MRIIIGSFFALAFSVNLSFGQNGFKIVPLGVKGGVNEGNLSAYMVAPTASDAYVCLDAGTINQGIKRAIANGVFSVREDIVLKNYIKAYFISHGHLDHISGMIINSADDTTKNLYGFDRCLKVIEDHYFNWQSWPNMGSAGAAPALRKYHYKVLKEGNEAAIERTDMFVQAFRLSHSNPYESAAFLIRHGEDYLLYCGDTGPDEVEKTDQLEQLWKAVAPLLGAGKLKGIFLEVSYPDDQPDRKLYGHLTPRWFMKELDKLGSLAGIEKMKDLNVIVTHIKPTGDNEERIKKELAIGNKLGVKLIFPEQGVGFELK